MNVRGWVRIVLEDVVGGRDDAERRLVRKDILMLKI